MSARVAWVTSIPPVMPLGTSAVVLLWQKAKSLPLKPSSLLSPAPYFSAYSSGFGIDLNREGRWGGGRTWGTRGRLKQRREEEEEPKAWWAGREEGQAGKKGRAKSEVERRTGEPDDKKEGSQGGDRSFPGGRWRLLSGHPSPSQLEGSAFLGSIWSPAPRLGENAAGPGLTTVPVLAMSPCSFVGYMWAELCHLLALLLGTPSPAPYSPTSPSAQSCAQSLDPFLLDQGPLHPGFSSVPRER